MTELPTEIPDFTSSQRKELAECGLVPEQVKELRIALLQVRARTGAQPGPGQVPDKRADPREVKARLEEIADLAATFDRLIRTPNRSTQQAMALLNAGLWRRQQTGQGTAIGWEPLRIGDHLTWIAEKVRPILAEMAAAAHDECAELPPTPPGRPRTADGTAVLAIKTALQTGWRLNSQQATAGRETQPPGLPMSRDPRSDFFKVVSVCFAAVGANPDPERAVRNAIQINRSHDP